MVEKKRRQREGEGSGASSAWHLAGGSAGQTAAERRAARAGAAQPTPGPVPTDTLVAKPAAPRRLLTRRTFVLGGFWSGLAMSVVGMIGAPLDFMWPRKVKGFGAPVSVSARRIPKPGADPVRIAEGRLWLVNLEPGQEGSPGGVLALYQKCPHLGCTVPWRPEFEFAGSKGWFRCPCHGSTYTKGGILVFGPSPRPLDTMKVEVQANGDLIVNTGQITLGGADDPLRAVALEGAAVAASGPRLHFEREPIDLGSVAIGRTEERTIEFHNRGNEPLTVKVVRWGADPDAPATCGCGVEDVVVEPEVVEAGGRGMLRVFVKGLEGMEGMEDNMLVELESNDPTSPQYGLKVQFRMAS
ncbi:MAG: Rieske 2Fe-2S domain-containing protein [Chloroflexota bacterium]|nr:Rieske 2Fe-2S domain-containing protein [Chloroflexota bacterium]